MKQNIYPTSIEALQAAMAFHHETREVAAVKWILRLPKEKRGPKNLVTIGKRFAERFLDEPLDIRFKAGSEDHFNHTQRVVQLGSPELIRLLHEIGHARFGLSERQAVAYSLGLIMKASPGFIPILRGHVLANDPY